MDARTDKAKNIITRILGTLYIPVLIYVIMLAIARGTGFSSFGGANTWINLIQNFAAAATIAFALGIQIKNGRFDFSGGAVMTLGAFISITVVNHTVNSPILFFVVCIIVCTILSTLVGFLYVFGRLPVMIATVGAAILFEALTPVINGGNGVNIASNASLNFYGKNLWACVILVIISALVYFFYTTYTVSGMHAEVLSNNQLAGVNIGIDERKNVIVTFIISGALYGIATLIFASQASPTIDVVSNTLATISTAFGSILPVFMGFYIGGFTVGTVGICFSSFSVATLKYCLTNIFASDISGAIYNIVYAVFLIIFFLISHQGQAVIQWCRDQLSAKHKKPQ